MTGRRLRSAAVLVLGVLVFAPAPASAQYGYNRYEAQYGEPVDASVDDLISAPSSYVGRAVRTHGNLELTNFGREVRPALRGSFGDYVLLYPVAEVQFEWDQEARRWYGKDVEITGVFGASSDQQSQVGRYRIVFWAYLGPPDRELPKGLKSQLVTLEDVVTKPGKHDGKVIHVVGKFRGQNLYGDLPARSRRSSADWVIKDDLYAVWVNGRKPKGDGWALDPKLKRDTGKWLDVVGRPTTVNGVTYIQAMQVSLGSAPSPAAEVAPPPPPPERPKVPPVVVFSLPLDGERDVPPTGRFAVQFSKDMNEESFKDRVLLRYAGQPQPGDRDFGAARISYDGGRRALIVDPGDVLRSGRVLELILLPGIVDIDGLPLEPRPGKLVGQAAEVLRYQVAF
ncbi:MAG TPA: Ig-like domain-containing protein [Vicinamibacteria bacterium]|nr:Ig-like domain-containing protein [Vicinamibacteria bacterium]